MKAPEVGTAVLDGLIEGPVPPFPDGEARLRQWVDLALQSGIRFQLTVDGPSFSLLAGGEPLRLGEFQDLRYTVEEAIGELLRAYPEDLRSRIFSTVRSTEYRQEEKVETIYLVVAKGVQARERKVPWDQKGEQDRAALASRVPLPAIAVCAALAAAALIVSFFVVDYRELLRQKLGLFPTFDPTTVEVDGASLSRYVTVKKVGADASGNRLEIEVRRSASFPTDLTTYDAEEARLTAEGKFRELIVLPKLVIDGNVRVTCLGSKGETLAVEEHSVRGLLDQEAVRISVSMRDHPGTVKVLVGY